MCIRDRVLAVLMGLSEHRPAMDQIFSIPRMWAFGTPSFDPGVTITCVIGALVLLSMSCLLYTSQPVPYRLVISK